MVNFFVSFFVCVFLIDLLYIFDLLFVFQMSCQRGSNSRQRKQKYQNASTFKNNLYDTSKTTKDINMIEHKGVCGHCKEVLEWRVHFRKYKPLTLPKKW